MSHDHHEKEDIEMLLLLLAPGFVLALLGLYRLALMIGLFCGGVFIVFSYLRRRRREKLRRPPGYCWRCGFDMRATPDRCPECGAYAGDE
jgi:hypothetical protein